MAFPFLLLASTAAGIGAGLAPSLFGNAITNEAQNRSLESKSRMSAIGAMLQQGEINIRMGQEELSASEESLMSIKKLREVMATQSAIMGARGQKQGVGSALTASTQSKNAFNADERARNLSLKFKKLMLENQKSISRIHQLAGESKIAAFKGTRAMKQGEGLFNKGFDIFSQKFGLNNL